jgi:hypothetical protein
MNLCRFASLFFVITIFTSCGNGRTTDDQKSSTVNPSIDPDGNCTRNFVEDYNEMVFSYRKIKETIRNKGTDEQLITEYKNLNTACINFLKEHNRDLICKALDAEDKSKLDTGYRNFSDPCETAAQVAKDFP